MSDVETIRVLLVEDDEDDYFITQDLLAEVTSMHVVLDWARNYQEGCARLQHDAYDVYIFDFRLGDRSGLDLLKEARTLGCAGPCIFLTGQSDIEIDMQVMRAGADDYLVKGRIDAALLERSIRYARERKKSADQVLFMAYHDNLTGLPNRTMFKERLQSAVSNTLLMEKQFAVLFLDIDNFKRINDTLGHKVGDLLLKEVSDRLRGSVRTSDTISALRLTSSENTIARLGGDEFTILLMDLKDAQAAAVVAQRVIDNISSPFYLAGTELYVTASIGIAIHPQDGKDIDTLLINADAAMYHAKKVGKNNFQSYRESLCAGGMERLVLENDLRKALERDQLQLYFQPIVDAREGRVRSMETLLRWQHPVMGIIGPDQFIPIAEETGVIVDIGHWVLIEAMRQFKLWRTAGIEIDYVSVNISCQQIAHPKFRCQLLEAIRDAAIDPMCLELEITESVALQHTAENIELFEELRAFNVRVAIDDFGSGYSSFNMLKRIPINTIKIDKSFIQDITDVAHNEAIIAAMVAMVRSLGLDAVVEGVETMAQLQAVQKHGCHQVQGFLFSVPLSAKQATEYLMNRQYVKVYSNG